MHADEVPVDAALVRELLAHQLPHLAELPLTIVEPWGTDHAIWRLGDELVVRLPRIGWAVGQVAKEAAWLPVLAGHLSVAVPAVEAVGAPSDRYPFPWAVHRWLPGRGADHAPLPDPEGFAEELAGVVRELWSVPPDGAPPAHNRARHVAEYDDAARRAIAGAAELVDAHAALDLWEGALAADPHGGPPRWVHGDLEGNCLVDATGRLCGLVDWGSACAGDPAVDIQVVWSTLFTEESRARFLAMLDVEEATLARARGAAVQQACAALPYYLDSYPEIVRRSVHKLRTLGVEVAIGSV